MVSPDDALLGRIALHYKLITQDVLTSGTAKQATATPPRSLGDVLLELKAISAEQLKWLHQAMAQYQAKQSGAPAPAVSAPAAPVAAARPAAAAPAPVPVAAAPAPVVEKKSKTAVITLKELLARSIETKASDVHIHTGAPIQMRVGGQLKELRLGVLPDHEVEAMLQQALSEEEKVLLKENLDFDAAIILPGVGRFRASFYKQQRGFDAVFRPIPPVPPTLAELGLPANLSKLADFHQGLVLFTGPAGSGKSSTLAAIVDMLNESRKDHIITVEDPIEYVYTKKQCVVNQRQAGKHTRSFANALRAALREDPDIIVIGELRDLETIQLAITAAETGHLVLGTLHTNNAIRTINRVLDVFPPKQQSQIRAMVSESLRAIVSQRLIPTVDGSKRVPALEILYLKPSISNLIREEKTFQIRSAMQTGRADGMILLDESIQELVKSGQITKEVARRFAEDPKRFA